MPYNPNIPFPINSSPQFPPPTPLDPRGQKRFTDYLQIPVADIQLPISSPPSFRPGGLARIADHLLDTIPMASSGNKIYIALVAYSILDLHHSTMSGRRVSFYQCVCKLSKTGIHCAQSVIGMRFHCTCIKCQMSFTFPLFPSSTHSFIITFYMFIVFYIYFVLYYMMMLIAHALIDFWKFFLLLNIPVAITCSYYILLLLLFLYSVKNIERYLTSIPTFLFSQAL